MKKIILFFLVCITSSSIFAQNVAGVVKFDKLVYDFGKIKQGVPVSYNFTFKNISKAPVTIETATASCGCTTPTWPQQPVMAGKTNVVKAGFNAAAAGTFDKTITVKIQGVELPVELKIKGEVLSPEDFAKIGKATNKPAPKPKVKTTK
jgi:Protein of unknown function (DUF1573)